MSTAIGTSKRMQAVDRMSGQRRVYWEIHALVINRPIVHPLNGDRHILDSTKATPGLA